MDDPQAQPSSGSDTSATAERAEANDSSSDANARLTPGSSTATGSSAAPGPQDPAWPADPAGLPDPIEYVLGRSPEETHRLQRQSRIFGLHSAHLLQQAGVGPGMHVLDIGCGAGDVSLMAASLVGPNGSVVGTDIDEDILSVAEQRAAATGSANVSFRHGDVARLTLDRPVDVLIGRFVLIHLAAPEAQLRSLARLVRPGGVITFQDVNASRIRAVPAAPLLDEGDAWICAALQAVGAEPDMGERLPAVFRGAGLRDVEAAGAVPATSDASLAAAYVTATLSSVLPVVLKNGIATADEVGIDTYESRLRAQLQETEATVFLPELTGAWVRLPKPGSDA